MMKKSFIPIVGIFCFFSIVACRKDMQKASPENISVNSKKEDRSFIIIAKEGEDLSAISEKLTEIGSRKFQIKESVKELGLITVITPDPSFPAKARKIAGVESVVVNISMNFRLPEKVEVSGLKSSRHSFASKAITDPFSVLQWGLESIKASDAWKKGYLGKNAVVAVLDGGFFLDEPEISGNIIGAQSFVYGEDVQFQGNGFSHGTHVAGTIAAAADGYGVVGVAPKASLLLVKVLSDNGFGTYANIIDGIYYAVNHKADVINMSLGGYLPTHTFIDDNGTPNDPSDDYIVEYSRDIKDLVKALNRATVFAKSLGTLVIAAAGNDAVDLANLPDYNVYPAQCLGVLAIAANGPFGWARNQDTNLHRPSSFTNYGQNIVSFGAPGGNIDPYSPLDTAIVYVYGIPAPAFVFNFVLSTGYYYDGDFYYTWAAGTSMAAPHASGVAALIYGKYRGRISPGLVQLVLTQSAKDYGAPGKDPYFGYGQVNAGKAIIY